MLGYCKDSFRALKNTIEHILEIKGGFRITEELCLEHERFMCTFFIAIKDLFNTQIPLRELFLKLLQSNLKRKAFEKRITEIVATPGEEFVCYITGEQERNLSEFATNIEDIRFNLSRHYA
jgi:hypothetical protein